MTPIVTVFCPIYNDSIYVDDLVSSVLHQTQKDFKFVILENGSVDNTRVKLKTHTDPRIKLITSHINYRSETGVNIARSFDSKYISIIFSDDTFLPEKLADSILALETTGADACFSNNIYVGSAGKALKQKDIPVSQFSGDITELSVAEHLWHMVKRGNTLHPVSMVIRTHVYHELGGFRGDLHQIGDMEFFARLLLQKKVHFIKKPLQNIRVHTMPGTRTNQSTVSDTMHMRVRSERLNFLNTFRTPEALSLVGDIFLPPARGITVPENMRLWFLGQQFVHEFEPDYRVFGMTCLYDALRQHGPEIEQALTTSIGVPPGVYMDHLATRVFSGFGVNEVQAAKIASLQLEVQSLRREQDQIAKHTALATDIRVSDLFSAKLSKEAFAYFQKKSEAPSKTSLRLLWRRRPVPKPFELPGFDSDFYVANDPALAGIDPLVHFLRFGWKEERNPSDYFNLKGYLQANPDVRTAGINPLIHFLEFGRNEGRVGWQQF